VSGARESHPPVSLIAPVPGNAKARRRRAALIAWGGLAAVVVALALNWTMYRAWTGVVLFAVAARLILARRQWLAVPLVLLSPWVVIPVGGFAMFVRDAFGGGQHLYAIRSMGVEVIGLEPTEYQQCYQGQVGMEVIAGYSCVAPPYGSTYPEALHVAFASAHNRLVVWYADLRGRRSCPRGSDWAGAFAALDNRLETAFGTSTNAWSGRYDSSFDVTVGLPSGASVAAAARIVCDTLSEHHVPDLSMRFVQMNSGAPPHPPHATARCLKGAVVLPE